MKSLDASSRLSLRSFYQFYRKIPHWPLKYTLWKPLVQRVCLCVCVHGCAPLIYSLSTGHEQDCGAADDWQDHGNDHQDRLHQLNIGALIGRVLNRLQSLDPTALPVVTLHTSAEQRGNRTKWRAREEMWCEELKVHIYMHTSTYTKWTDAALTCTPAPAGPLYACSSHECSSPGGWRCRDPLRWWESMSIRWWGRCAQGWKEWCFCSSACSSSCLCLSFSFSHLCWVAILQQETLQVKLNWRLWCNLVKLQQVLKPTYRKQRLLFYTKTDRQLFATGVITEYHQPVLFLHLSPALRKLLLITDLLIPSRVTDELQTKSTSIWIKKGKRVFCLSYREGWSFRCRLLKAPRLLPVRHRRSANSGGPPRRPDPQSLQLVHRRRWLQIPEYQEHRRLLLNQ